MKTYENIKFMGEEALTEQGFNSKSKRHQAILSLIDDIFRATLSSPTAKLSPEAKVYVSLVLQDGDVALDSVTVFDDLENAVVLTIDITTVSGSIRNCLVCVFDEDTYSFRKVAEGSTHDVLWYFK